MKPLLIFAVLLFLTGCKQQSTAEKDPPIENPYEIKANSFLSRNEVDSSFMAFDQARLWYLERQDTSGVVNCLINMAITQYEQSDVFGASETATQALSFIGEVEESEHATAGMIYNLLGNVSDEMSDSDKAIAYYKKAIAYTQDEDNLRVYNNNLALSFQANGQYEEALAMFSDILPKMVDNHREYARTLNNYARAKARLDSTYDPIADYRKAMEIRKSKQDAIGLNSSYATLSKYYTRMGDLDSAKYYGTLHYQIAQQNKNPKEQVRSLNQLLGLNGGQDLGPLFVRYNTLRDSLDSVRTMASNQFALIRYEVEKNKAENLQLQSENARKNYRLNLLVVVIVALLVLAVMIGLYARNWYRRRELRLEMEKVNAIQESKLKTSRKVHDVVANGIYRVMAEIENRDHIDQEQILDRLEVLYDKSRDISYEVEDDMLEEMGFSQEVSALLQSFDHEDRHIMIVGNDRELWSILGKEGKEQVLAILQELMVNMDKHSLAADVVLRFEPAERGIRIVYQDNGVGMPSDQKFGNGLHSTGNRIKSLHGTINFDSMPAGGLKIDINLPRAK